MFSYSDKCSWVCSTVTRKILETHGSWEFEDELEWNIGLTTAESMAAADVYQPLSMEGDLVDITDSPIGTHKPTQILALHIQILRALRGAQDRIESLELKLHLPRDWGVSLRLRILPTSTKPL
jgi:hypothetical protein